MAGLTRRALFGYAVCCLCFAGGARAAAQVPPAIQRAAQSTVLIEANWEVRGRYQGNEAREFVDSNGSGFVIAPQGIILTNNHVVDPAYVESEIKRQYAELANLVEFSVRRTSLTIRAFSGSDDEIKRPGNVIRSDRKNDLALMSVNFGRDMPYLQFHAPVTVPVGTQIAACGFPANSVMRTLVANRPKQRGTEVSVSLGRITALRRDRERVVRFLQMDAAVVGGNSGGPVVDGRGLVVGVLSSTVGGNVNFAIASDTVYDFAKNYIRAEDRPPPATTGVADEDALSGAPEAPPTGEVIVHLRNGGKERGILKRETADKVVLKLEGLGTITYRRDEITHIERVSP